MGDFGLGLVKAETGDEGATFGACEAVGAAAEVDGCFTLAVEAAFLLE